ncbi:dipeptidase [Candidatus Formimonas warabiya]|uniref:Membrane dipeptidase n=1 Tax=Formimonas warabiya TaxID=1761012 RepID=A0A3G1L124_FORW1|nr:dipeptidase [Candidatus Formimonas warabiya]ATW28367.1 hypothetical protein DCMF_05030 [Candidatus Formimonas warabiya]
MIIADAHCDTLLKITDQNSLYDLGDHAHVDLKRLKNNVHLQVFAAFIQSRYKPFQSLQSGLKLIEIFHREMEKNHPYVKVVTTREDLKNLENDERIHTLLSIEGGEILCGDIFLLKVLFRLGVRSICLTWNQRNEIADGCWESNSGSGLTSFGITVINQMNLLGMLIDVSHISERGFWSVLEHTQQPILVSHANCKRLCPHIRNLDDGQIKALRANGGVMGITFTPDFLGSGMITVDDVLKHIDYAVSLVGPDYVGLGSDFDGTDHLPQGLEDVTKIFLIAEGLLKRGYRSTDIEKIMGDNFVRLCKKVLPEK